MPKTSACLISVWPRVGRSPVRAGRRSRRRSLGRAASWGWASVACACRATARSCRHGGADGVAPLRGGGTRSPRGGAIERDARSGAFDSLELTTSEVAAAISSSARTARAGYPTESHGSSFVETIDHDGVFYSVDIFQLDRSFEPPHYQPDRPRRRVAVDSLSVESPRFGVRTTDVAGAPTPGRRLPPRKRRADPSGYPGARPRSSRRSRGPRPAKRRRDQLAVSAVANHRPCNVTLLPEVESSSSLGEDRDEDADDCLPPVRNAPAIN